MRIVCAIFDYSSYLPIGVGAQSINLGGQLENVCMRKNNKIPEFYMIGLFARKVFFLLFWEMPPFPTPMYFLSSISVVQITRKFCACDCSGIRAVAGIFWIEFRTLLDDVTLAISYS